jgi:hypothetical protein
MPDHNEVRKLPKYLTTVTPLSKGIAMAILIIGPFAGFMWGRSYQSKYAQQVSPNSESSNDPCSLTVNGYDGVRHAKVDLRGNKTFQIFRLYTKPSTRLFPLNDNTVLVKLFDQAANCYTDAGLQKEFPADSFGDVEVINNFWGDLRDAVVFITKKSGINDQFLGQLHFAVFIDNKFQIIDGPTLDELSGYKFTDQTNKSSGLYVVKPQIDAEDGGNFTPHRYKVFKYIYNGTSYTESFVGLTDNKYLPDINAMMEAEPQLFQ